MNSQHYNMILGMEDIAAKKAVVETAQELR